MIECHVRVKGKRLKRPVSTQMPLKVDLSQFDLKPFRSYARFAGGQEGKLRSSFDHHFAMSCFVGALEAVSKRRSGTLIGGVPIAESTDGQILFQITCLQKIGSGIACDDFFTAACRRECVQQFCAELEEQYQRSAAIYLPASDSQPVKPKAVRLHHRRGVKVVSPNGLPVKCVDRTSRWGNPFEIGRDGTREEVVQKYRDWFLSGTEPRKRRSTKSSRSHSRTKRKQSCVLPARSGVPCRFFTRTSKPARTGGAWYRRSLM